MMGKTLGNRTAVGLLLALTLAATPIGKPAQAQNTLGGMAGDITETFQALGNLITGGAYIGGLADILGSIVKFHQWHFPPAIAPLVVDRLSSRLAMSCPVFVGGGTQLGEDTCIWARMGGETVSSGAPTTATNSLDWYAGGQAEIAPGWFLGGTLGVRARWMPSGPASAQGRSFDASVVVKRVDGPLFLAAALGVSSETSETTRSAIGPGGAMVSMTGNSSAFSGSLRLRGAYEIAFERWYLRPRADIDVGFINRSGLQEAGPAFGLTIDPVSKAAIGLTPALEIGGRVDVGYMILRPYVSGGAIFLPDNTSPVSGTVAGIPFSTTIAGPSVIATVEAGLQLYESKSWEMRIDYRLLAANSFLSQSVGLRAAKHF